MASGGWDACRRAIARTFLMLTGGRSTASVSDAKIISIFFILKRLHGKIASNGPLGGAHRSICRLLFQIPMQFLGDCDFPSRL